MTPHRLGNLLWPMGHSPSHPFQCHTGNLKVPWGTFLRSRPVWAIIVAHFCFNWGYYTLLAWLPSYFELALGLNVGNSSFLTLVPYVAMSLMTPVVGQVADRLVSNGWAVGKVRKLAQVVPCLLLHAVVCSVLYAAIPDWGV